MAVQALIETIVSGALTGGAGAATTLLAFFRDVRKRIDHIEKVIGNPGSPMEAKTGFHFLLWHLDEGLKRLDESLRKLRRDMDSWDDEPPEWAIRLVNRRGSASFTTEAWQGDVETKFRSLERRIVQIEEDLERAVKDLKFTYAEDSRKRAEELHKVQNNLQTANGFLRGVMAALGYLDEASAPSSPPPALPPMPPRRK